MKKINFKVVLIFCLLLSSSGLYSQETLVAFANSKEKDFFSEFKYAPYTSEAKKFKPEEKGTGDCANFKKGTGLPVKVALISFYTFDKGVTTKQKGYSYTVVPNGYMSTRTTTFKTSYNTGEKAAELSTALFEMSIDNIQKHFKDAGMNLLLPDEYLTDTEKLEAYQKFEPVGGLANKIFKQDENIKSRGSAAGFLTKPVNSDNFDRLTWESYGQFAKTLGVDAVCIIMNEIESEDKNININKVGIYIYGPNPVAKEEGKKIMKYYDGLCYEGAFLMIGKAIQKGLVYTGEGATLVANGKKNSGEYFNGYPILMDRFVGKVIANMNEKKNN